MITVKSYNYLLIRESEKAMFDIFPQYILFHIHDTHAKLNLFKHMLQGKIYIILINTY